MIDFRGLYVRRMKGVIYHFRLIEGFQGIKPRRMPSRLGTFRIFSLLIMPKAAILSVIEYLIQSAFE